MAKSKSQSQPLVAKKGPWMYADHVPLWAKPYVQLTRIDKFAGTMLVFWPCAWGLALAASEAKLDPRTLAIELAVYFFGSFWLHSAACTINDICDREFDRKVERTKTRPLAAGTVSVFAAVVFLLAQVAFCVWLFSLTNPFAFKVGLLGIFPFHAVYPLMKRITYWPQAWLGIAMNWGLLLAWADVTGSIDWSVIGVFFLGTWCWTIHYDTLYACQDRKDDKGAGVKSTALLFGDYVKPILFLFDLVFIGTLAHAGLANGKGMQFFVISVAGSALHMMYQLWKVDLEDPASCYEAFHSNGTPMGYIVFAGMIVDYYYKVVVA